MRLFLGLFILGVTFLAAPPSGHAGGAARLMVVDSARSKLSPELMIRVRSAVGAAGGKAGMNLVASEGATTCSKSDCVLAVGAAAGATHVAWVEASFQDESYALSIELWDVEGRRTIANEARECAICASQDLMDAVADRAESLFSRAQQTPAFIPPSPEPVRAPQPGPPPTTTAPEPSPWMRPRVLFGAGLVLAGVGAGVTGLYYIAEDGSRVPGSATSVRDTKTTGIILGLTGAVAVAGGLGLLTWHLFDGTTVALTPQGALLAGRF